MRILFDFDGTLFDSYPNIVENIYQEIADERKHIIPKEEVYRLVKVNAKFAMDMLEFNEEQRKRVYSKQYDVIPELNKPFPHIEKVLQYASKNVIMTHKSGDAVREILEFYNMSHYFEEIVSKDSGFPKKPNPESYKYLHEKYHIDLVIGDRQLDLMPGKELDIVTCSYQNHLPAADYYIDDYSNFPLVVLGMKYDVKSHSKKKPELNESWLKQYFDVDSQEYRDILKTVETTQQTEIAFLYKLGLSPKVKRTGYYPLDGALFALEHGFKASVVKTILLHNRNREEIDSNKEVKEIIDLFESFLTPYVEEKIKNFNCDF
ncbi:HAD-IA family hydrolase [Bacillus cereus]